MSNSISVDRASTSDNALVEAFNSGSGRSANQHWFMSLESQDEALCMAEEYNTGNHTVLGHRAPLKVSQSNQWKSRSSVKSTQSQL
jgi:hypothetical protein